MPKVEIVGGLDPSLNNFGMSKGTLVHSDDGSPPIFTPTQIQLIRTKANPRIQYRNEDDLFRAFTLMEGMTAFFEDVERVYAELPVGSRSSRAQTSYGVSIGVIAAIGEKVIRVSAKDVKIAATGDSEASKKQMIDWAVSLYPDLPWLTKKSSGKQIPVLHNEHIADSLACIHAGLKSKE